jgi:hypothetical protein
VVALTLLGTLASGCQSPNLPVFADRGGDSLTALGTGDLEIQDGCLVLVGSDTVYLVLWPPGTTWDDVTDTVIVHGQRARVGDPVTLGGGESEAGPVGDLSNWITPPSEDCLAIGRVFKAFSVLESESPD